MSDANTTLRCICCQVELRPCDAAEVGVNQPYAGTTFRTNGHYGSTAFDPIGSFIASSGGSKEFLELNICDACLKLRAQEGYVLHGIERKRHEELDVKLWEPET